MTFTKQVDGSITVDAFDDVIEVSPELLDAADHAFIWQDQNEIVITVANGQAAYRLLGYSPNGLDFVYERVRRPFHVPPHWGDPSSPGVTERV